MTNSYLGDEPERKKHKSEKKEKKKKKDKKKKDKVSFFVTSTVAFPILIPIAWFETSSLLMLVQLRLIASLGFIVVVRAIS